MTEVVLPYQPRDAFLEFHKRKQRWAVIVAHRRAGKTVACLMDMLDHAIRAQIPNARYAYISPFYVQSKAVAWDYLKAFSRPLLAAAPNESELRVDLKNGARISLYGGDNGERLRGLALDGVILDEFADMSPSLWAQVVRPALADRKGWGVFIGTVKGRNQLWQNYEHAKERPDEWFSAVLRASETGIIDEEELSDARRTMSEEAYAAEFECDPNAAVIGAYYGKLMQQADTDGRIAGVPYEPTVQVYTAWDLGIRDSTAIWFAQVVGREIRIIDYYEASGADLGHYVREIGIRPYLYAGHIVPHDAQAKELGTGKSRLEVLESLELKNITVAPMHRVEDGINAVRTIIPRCWFDAKKCARGIDALKLYRAEFDDKLQALKPRPVHDWTSHAADAFRYLSMTLDTMIRPVPTFAEPEEDWVV